MKFAPLVARPELLSVQIGICGRLGPGGRGSKSRLAIEFSTGGEIRRLKRSLLAPEHARSSTHPIFSTSSDCDSVLTDESPFCLWRSGGLLAVGTTDVGRATT
jgi:hypothetical protein